jgi:hypothetical protein
MTFTSNIPSASPSARFMAAGLALAFTTGLSAQVPVGPVCDRPSFDYPRCAIAAAGIDDLAYPRALPADREVRYWMLGGTEPDRLVIIRHRGDSISGQLYRIWQAEVKDTASLGSICTAERWSSGNGDICVARREPMPDWAGMLRTLDSLRVATMPIDRALEQGCRPGAPYDARTCGHRDPIYFHSIEMREGWGTYWRYQFTGQPDSASIAGKRDLEIRALLSCVTSQCRPE